MGKFFRGLWNFITKALAVTCAILFVLMAVVALFLYNLEQRAFDAQIYEQALVDQNIYARLPGLMAELLITSIGFDPCAENPIACGVENRSPELHACLEEALGKEAYAAMAGNERLPTEAEVQRAQPCFDQYGWPEKSQSGGEGEPPPPFLKNLTAKDWETIVVTLLPPESLKKLTAETLKQILFYLNGKTDTARISLVELKANLSSEAGIRAILQLFRAQPPCTPEQLAQLTEVIHSGQGGMVYCNPPDEIIAAVQPMLQGQLNDMVTRIPDEAVIIRPSASSIAPGEIGPLAGIRLVRAIMRLSPLAPLGLLLGITVLVIRSLRDWLRWWGIPLLIAGLFSIVLGWTASPIFNLLFTAGVADKAPPNFPTIVIEIGRDLAWALLHSTIEVLVLQALIVAAIGLVMTVAASFIKAKTGMQAASPPASTA